MAMEECHAGIAGDEIDLGFLIAAQHQDIFHESCRWIARVADQFERMPMQMNRVNVITGIAHPDAVAGPVFQMV